MVNEKDILVCKSPVAYDACHVILSKGDEVVVVENDYDIRYKLIVINACKIYQGRTFWVTKEECYRQFCEY